MNAEQSLYDLLDNYFSGKLSVDEADAVEYKLKNEPDFRAKAEQHKTMRDAMKHYGNRMELKAVLDSAHLDIEETAPVTLPVANPVSGWKRYWPMTAVAASVALISIVGTLMMTRALETKQTAIYKELRRNVDQIKHSQKMLMKDIAQSIDKGKPVPSKYAGTGFLISSNGYVATSYHVVKEADSVYIENEKFGRQKVSVVLSDPANDIAVLKLQNDSVTGINRILPFSIVKDEANLGEHVFTLGFPREDIVFGEGSISASTGYSQNPNAYQISVPVNPGNSGGPLFNESGDLVGIISGVQTETLGAAFAIKSSVVMDAITRASLDTLERPLVLPKYNTIKNSNRVQQIKRWKDYVFIVQVYKN
ncbi:S1 family peptidase [Ohtaekwangia koreensis]|uniref:Trypsin-like peptidase domain-containing protein n=1 Tax=Ohtaekwangia koreensis TaxID=688867 RepID=A0A1T5MCM0_9BACT|nr:serine protease [Ohtaekwangia koreensis]SKC85905.1 Trypsin-like peptidase domain-containing protein [Ohtaekwangia koreensis]